MRRRAVSRNGEGIAAGASSVVGRRGGSEETGGVGEGCVRAQLRRDIVAWLADIWRRDDRGKAAEREISCARATLVGAGQLLFRP